MATYTQLPDYSQEHLAQLSELQLIELMIRDEDRVPRNVIDECVRRGAAMEQGLHELLSIASDWDEDYFHSGSSWLRFHAAMILGMMSADSAGRLLIELMLRIEQEEFDHTEEWLTGSWAALFLNKSAAVMQNLQPLAGDRRHGIFVRAGAYEAYIAWLHAHDRAAFESQLSWLAEMALNEQDDWHFRLLCASTLIDFPRAPFRALLTDLAARQTAGDICFSLDEVELAYTDQKDSPEWASFSDPWQFYSPEAIEQRQARWAAEDAEDLDESWLDDPEYLPELDDYTEPYVREIPKVGRNDPCPCGSGKKYKKCCLANEAL